MIATCPNCRAQLNPQNNTRCQSCGRSLAQAANHPEQFTDGTSRSSDASKSNWVSEYIVHIIIALLCGIVGFVVTLFLFRRIAVWNSDSPILWIVCFGFGFCLPAAYGFRYSYEHEVMAKRRKKEGIQAMRKDG